MLQEGQAIFTPWNTQNHIPTKSKPLAEESQKKSCTKCTKLHTNWGSASAMRRSETTLPLNKNRITHSLKTDQVHRYVSIYVPSSLYLLTYPLVIESDHEISNLELWNYILTPLTFWMRSWSVFLLQIYKIYNIPSEAMGIL